MTAEHERHRPLIVNNGHVDTRRLQLLLALSRLGSMRAVAETYRLTTSTVSQQIAALAKRNRRSVDRTGGTPGAADPPGGRRLADHAVTILAAIDSARLDLDPDAEPSGVVRIGGFATGIRVSLLPIVADLAATYPRGRTRHQRVRTGRGVLVAQRRQH